LGGEGRGQAVNFGGGFFVAGVGLTGSGGLENGQEGSPLGICEAGGVAVVGGGFHRERRETGVVVFVWLLIAPVIF